MNLIERLGGYEKAKAIVTQNIKDFEEAVDEVGIYHPSSGWIVHEDLVKELLEYRRQHNIFEVGDKVVLKRPDQFSEIYTYDAYSEKMDLLFLNLKVITVMWLWIEFATPPMQKSKQVKDWRCHDGSA